MTTVPVRPAIPPGRGKRHNVKSYSLWEWTRAYMALVLLAPIWLIGLALNGRKLPKSITRKLLQAHNHYVSHNPMDFRIPPDRAIPPYMLRWWRLPRNWAFNIYYHFVMRSDDDRALHDHPWWSFSIVLAGGYYEHEILEGGIHRHTWRGPGMMTFRWTGRKAHRLQLAANGSDEEPATTIFITGPVLRRWGFHHESGWIDAYEWDSFCEINNIGGMRMDGGSDAAISPRNKL